LIKNTALLKYLQALTLKKIAILQPNYLPWKGVFDLINMVDLFVFFDDVQYTRRDWRNRNIFKTPNGNIFLSVPVQDKRGDLIKDVKVDTTSDWQLNHYKTIKLNYSKAPYFLDYKYIIDEIFLSRKWSYLIDLNIFSTQLISEALGIKANWIKSSELNVSGSKQGGRAIEICKTVGATHFINGPKSKEFMNDELFTDANIDLSYIEYQYPEYPQLYGDFTHQVSILDLIFNCGNNSPDYIFTKQRGINGSR
jgi:hypothetical protein